MSTRRIKDGVFALARGLPAEQQSESVLTSSQMPALEFAAKKGKNPIFKPRP
jgi:hypothetical protein